MYKKRIIEQSNLLEDSYLNLSKREQKMLEKSWAYPFGNNIFPLIEQDCFKVLYSDKASRPSTPVNILVGALILKELNGLTDDELLEALLFDVRYQYALHTTSFEEQPLSDKSLQRFRNRLLTYQTATGIDLVHETMNTINSELVKLMKINTTLKRMDSFMIESNIRKLSRMELIYVTISNFVKRLKKEEKEIPDEMKHYLEESDQNQFIYHSKISSNEKMNTLLKDIKTIHDQYNDGSCDEYQEYQLLIRVVKEQLKESEDGFVLKGKEDGMSSQILQNPADPEATYRSKAGKSHRGYVGNVEESGESGNTLITDYDVQSNDYSDIKFMEDTLEHLEEGTTIVVDGAYANVELIEKAEEKGIEIVPTALTGKETNEFYEGFELNEDETAVIKCPNGVEPVKSRISKSEQITVRFDVEKCKTCPFKDQCKPKMNSKTGTIILSAKTIRRAKIQKKLSTDSYKQYAKYRNGVESLPSEMRRKYKIDQLPVRGKQVTRMWLGFKVIAHNAKKYMKNRWDQCAQNSEIMAIA